MEEASISKLESTAGSVGRAVMPTREALIESLVEASVQSNVIERRSYRDERSCWAIAAPEKASRARSLSCMMMVFKRE